MPRSWTSYEEVTPNDPENADYPGTQYADEPRPTRRRACVLVSCLTAFVVVAGALVGTYFILDHFNKLPTSLQFPSGGEGTLAPSPSLNTTTQQGETPSSTNETEGESNISSPSPSPYVDGTSHSQSNVTVPPPDDSNGNISTLCGVEYMKYNTQMECMTICEPSSCCFDITGNETSCATDNREVCALYEPCKNLPLWGQGGNDSVPLDLAYEGNVSISDPPGSGTSFTGMPPQEGFNGTFNSSMSYCGYQQNEGVEPVCNPKGVQCTSDADCNDQDNPTLTQCLEACGPLVTGGGGSSSSESAPGAALWSICAPLRLTEEEVKLSCNDTSLEKQCDPSLANTGCNETEQCYPDICSLTPQNAEENYCFNLEQAMNATTADGVCSRNRCTGDTDCGNGELCSSSETCANFNACCSIAN